MSHWATQYIGRPWVYGKAGPDEFDCWGFVRYIQREHFGVEMPEVAVADRHDWRNSAQQLAEHDERKHWTRVVQPVEGDVVLMARNRLPTHIGLWVAANGTLGVLHCLEGAGVLYSPARALQAAGWGALQHYRHESKCTS